MYVTYVKKSETIGRVDAVYNNPEDFDFIDNNGFDVDEIPSANTVTGMNSVLMVRLPDKELYYDYVSSPPTVLDAIEDLKRSQAEQDSLIMSLLLGGGADVE